MKQTLNQSTQKTSTCHKQMLLANLPDPIPKHLVSNDPLLNLNTSKNEMSFLNLKIMSLNCCSLRSLSKRLQLASLLCDHNIDIVIGCELHIDQLFLTSEILPPNYKLIRKDHSLGGGGVFIGSKNHLGISEVKHISNDCGANSSYQSKSHFTYAPIIDHQIVILFLSR